MSTNLDLAKSQGANALIDKNFKTATVTDPTKDPAIAIKLDWAKSRIKTALYINNAVSEEISRTNGKFDIKVQQDVGQPMTTCVTGILDTGFYTFDTACRDQDTQSRYIWLERTEKATGVTTDYLRMNELRLYQMLNLLDVVPGVTITGPPAGHYSVGAENLITNLSQRSSTWLFKSIKDLNGNRSTQQSGYHITRTSLTATGYKATITLDLQGSYFQHAIVIVASLEQGYKHDDDERVHKSLQNFEVYVGDNSLHKEEDKCEGGPFLVNGDASSTTKISYTDDDGVEHTDVEMWKYGMEVWCNQKGRYTTIVVDLSTATVDSVLRLLQLGVFGTKYISTYSPPSIQIDQQAFLRLDIPPITPDPSLPIGNSQNIWLRQKGDGTKSWWLPWVSIYQQRITIQPYKNTVPGDYTLFLEFYDDWSGDSQKHTLHTLEMPIKVTPLACSSPLYQAFTNYDTILILGDYNPKIYFPVNSFVGPHTTDPPCDGDYTMSIALASPNSYVTIHNPADGSTDMRPWMQVSPINHNWQEVFRIKLTGTFVFTDGSPTLTATFMVNFKIVTPYQMTQTQFKHSSNRDFNVQVLSAATLNDFDLTPVSIYTPWVNEFMNFMDEKFFNRYNYKPAPCGQEFYPSFTDPKDYTSVPLEPLNFEITSVPSFTNTEWTAPYGKFNSEEVDPVTGTPLASIPSTQIMKLSCDAWSLALEGQSIRRDISFRQETTTHKVLFPYWCIYATSLAPTFTGVVPTQFDISVGKAQNLALPTVDYNLFAQQSYTGVNSDPAAMDTYLRLDPNANQIVYNGSAGAASLVGLSISMKITAIGTNNKQVECTISIVVSLTPAPVFRTAPISTIEVVPGNFQQWQLPEIDTMLTLSSLKMTPDSQLSTYFSFTEANRTITYNGDSSVEAFRNENHQIAIRATDSIKQHLDHTMAFSIPCPITDQAWQDVDDFMPKESIQISTMAGLESSATAYYNSVYERIAVALNYDTLAQQSCGAIKISLFNENQLDNLKHDASSKTVILESNKSAKSGTFSDSYIQFQLLDRKWKLKIVATLAACQVSKLRFEQQTTWFTYEVSTAKQVVQIPSVVQEPDCGYSFNSFKINGYESFLSTAQLDSAIKYDQTTKSVEIQTDDVSLGGWTVKIKVAVDQTSVSDTQDFEIMASFVANPPRLDFSLVSIPLITCSPEDASWAVDLPEPTYSGDDPVEISLKKEQSSSLASLFDLDNDGKKLTLKSSTVEAFEQGNLSECQSIDSIPLQLTLSTQLYGDTIQQVDVPVYHAEIDNKAQNKTDDDPSQSNQGNSTGKFKYEIKSDSDEQEQKEAQKEKLKISKVTVSSTSLIKLYFSKPIKPLPFQIIMPKQDETTETAPSKRNLQIELPPISSIMELKIDEDDNDEDYDKSIVEFDMTYASETEVSIQAKFADAEAISQDILEPDTLIISIQEPVFFIDKETNEPLSLKPIFLQLEIGAQFSAQGFKELEELTDYAASVGIGITIWQLILIFAVKKMIFSMWVLILTLQFLVYLTLWKIRYPAVIRLILYQLKRLALGEFIDDFDFSGEFMNYLGLEQQEDTSKDEKLGEERLGSSSPLSNLGPTLIIAIILVSLSLIIIFIAMIAARYDVRCSEKCKGRVRKFEQKIFFNPFIRLLILNSLKMNFAGLKVFKTIGDETSILDILSSSLILLSVNGLPIYFCCVIKKHRDSLKSEKARLTFGALYKGMSVTQKNHKLHLLPILFFWRRLAFMAATIFLFNHPILQMYLHYLLILLTIFAMGHQCLAFEEQSRKVIEIGSEYFLLTTSAWLALFMNRTYTKESREYIQYFTIFSFGCLIFLNIGFIIRGSVIECKEKCRKKRIMRNRRKYAERKQTIKTEIKSKFIALKMDAIPEESSQNSSSLNNSSMLRMQNHTKIPLKIRNVDGKSTLKPSGPFSLSSLQISQESFVGGKSGLSRIEKSVDILGDLIEELRKDQNGQHQMNIVEDEHAYREQFASSQEFEESKILGNDLYQILQKIDKQSKKMAKPEPMFKKAPIKLEPLLKPVTTEGLFGGLLSSRLDLTPKSNVISLDGDSDPNADRQLITLSENQNEPPKDANSPIGHTQMANLPIQDHNLDRSKNQRQSDIFGGTEEVDIPTQEIVWPQEQQNNRHTFLDEMEDQLEAIISQDIKKVTHGN